jgi:hypothetical protein
MVLYPNRAPCHQDRTVHGAALSYRQDDTAEPVVVKNIAIEHRDLPAADIAAGIGGQRPLHGLPRNAREVHADR